MEESGEKSMPGGTKRDVRGEESRSREYLRTCREMDGRHNSQSLRYSIAVVDGLMSNCMYQFHCLVYSSALFERESLFRSVTET